MPRSSPAPVRQPYKNTKLIRDLQAVYGKRSLRKWAELLTSESGVKVTHGTLHRALNMIEPRQPQLRAALGFAPLVVVAQPCRHCGQVHAADVCFEQPPAGGLQPVTIWARRVRAGAVVLARSRRCARRRCGVHFVPVNASQRYCSAECSKRTKLVRSRR